MEASTAAKTARAILNNGGPSRSLVMLPGPEKSLPAAAAAAATADGSRAEQPAGQLEGSKSRGE